jgi:tRNA A-37 threonylcarbamoyl transferase component Bud32
MLTLMRCRRAAGKAISDTGDSVEIRYESRFAIKELIDVFRKTFDEWSVFGPVLLSIATVPIWTSTIAMFFMLPTYMMRVTDNNVALLKILSELWEQAYRYLGEVADKGGHHVADVAGSPLVVIAVTVVAMAMVYGLLKTVLRPNRIIVQADSINLTFRLGARLYTRKIAIETITKISLHKPSDMADPSKWFIRIELNNKKPVDLSIAALNSEERTKLTKSIQRLAPQIPIDSALLETLIPRQDRSYTELWLQSLSTAPERKSMEPLQPGQMLSSLRYLVIRCLGVGGQGTAYLCKDTGLVESHLSDMVVLKESIFPVYADSTVRMQALERFEKEASLLRRLEHPGIVGLRDYFLEDHRGYLVMEHAEGKTLKQLVEEEGVLSEMRVRELALQMCDTLAYLHANGVVHRDFTPDNLILSKSGQLKVIDFNVAQQMEAGSAGTIVGKQSYLPPEQFRGKASTQSDIYAMGATLQFLLTGEDPEPISQSSPLESGAACSATLDQIVRNCTALQTQKRIGSAEELKEQLLAGRSAPEETTVIKTAKELEPHELSLNGDSDSEASIKLNLAKQEDLLEMENK